MKTRMLVLISVSVACVPLGFSATSTPPSAPIQTAAADPFLRTPSYRQVSKLESTDISPFKKPEARADQAAAQVKPSGPNVSAVLAKFTEMGLTGVIPSTPICAGTIILGGNIYREGQKLQQFTAKSRTGIPLVADHIVILTSVTAQALQLSVKHILDPDHPPLNVPVILLEFMQR